MNSEPETIPIVVEEQLVCKTCSNAFVGKFCNRCGEKVISQHDRSIGHFLHEIVHVLTHAEVKIFKNLKLMITNPGFVSKNYVTGVRQPFMKPVALFFVANLIYFLVPMFQTFSTNLSSQINAHPYSNNIRPMVEKRMQEKNVTFAELAAQYNVKTATYSKLILILLVPLFALAFAIVNFKRASYFADHLLMGLEFSSFLLFYNVIFLAAFVQVVSVVAWYVFGLDITTLDGSETYFVFPVVIVSTLYFLYRSERTFYQQKVWLAGVKALGFLLFCPLVIYFYRFVLFHVTMRFM
jgi:hypothetical protein